jgi:hypothetical protein
VEGSAEEQQDWHSDVTAGCTQALFRREVSRIPGARKAYHTVHMVVIAGNDGYATGLRGWLQ